MAAIYKALASCFAYDQGDANGLYEQDYYGTATANGKDKSSEQHLADDIVQTLLQAEKPGKDLKRQLHARVSTYGWRESLAKRVLKGLIKAIETGALTSQMMKDAYDEAEKIATAFAKEHPILTAAIVTLIAIGVLVMLAPYIVEALGFGELGPIAGSWAAWWQAGFPNVPKGSFFSWLQRLGMVWGGK